MKRTITFRNMKLTFEIPTTVQLALIDYALKQMLYDQLAVLQRPLAYTPAAIREAARQVRGIKLLDEEKAQ